MYSYRVRLRRMLAFVQPLKRILVAVCRVNVTRNEVPIFREDLHYNAYQDTGASKYDAVNRGK
jgi:hypothetical protein